MLRNNLLKPIGLAILVIISVVLPFLLGEYYVDVLIKLLIDIILVVSFRFITLMGGWSLAHIPLWGLGGYVSAILGKTFGWPFWLNLPLAGIGVASVALIMGYPLARTKGFAFFLASFAAGEAMRLSWTRFPVPFGGHQGLSGIPSPESIPIPGLQTIDFGQAIPYYFLALMVTTLCLMLIYRLERCRIGDTLKAIYAQENLSKSIGINITEYKMLAFVIGAFFAGIAGALLVYRMHVIYPSGFSFVYALYLLVWVIVGGYHTFAGPILGVVTLTLIQELLRPLMEWVPMVFGFILILTILFLPGGLESLPKRISPLVEKIQMIGRRIMRYATRR